MYLLVRLLAVALALSQMLQTWTHTGPQWEALGTPTARSYSQKQWKARSIWDLALVDGVLYAGSGDYDTNTGPTDIWAYDPQSGTWSVSGTLNDEAISRFVLMEDKLIAPGIDSHGSTWEYGNYHILQGGKWTTFARLPGAVHNFDVAAFDGRMFFALGTGDDSSSPVLVSKDGKGGFTQVPFYKDDAPVLGTGANSFTRVYDFFVVEQTLYCMFLSAQEETYSGYEFYRFTDDRFEFVSAAADHNMQLRSMKQVPIAGKACVKDTCYIAAGKLYRTDDFASFTQVKLPDDGYVTDLFVAPLDPLGPEVLYVLYAVQTQSGAYRSSICALVADDVAVPVAEYTASCPAQSFVKDGDSFYVGFGGGNDSSGDVGKVIRLTP